MRIEVRSPYDGTLAGSVEASGADDDVDRSLAAAYELFRDRGGWLTPGRRIELRWSSPPRRWRSRPPARAASRSRIPGWR